MILAFRDVAALVVVNGLLLAAIAADLALAAPIRPLLLSRGRGGPRCYLGQARASHAGESPTPATPVLRADVRDAWQPSSGAGSDTTLRGPAYPAGGPSRRDHHPHAQPPRATRRAAAVTVRSLGPLGLAARQARRQAPVDESGCCRRSAAAATCRRNCPASASSMGSTGRCCAARAASSTPLREYVYRR